MYSATVRKHIMIAHSFRGEIFGPAQRLHGATFVVDVEFRRRELDPDGVVVDIGRASEVLAGVLAPLDYRNLDELPEFAGVNTTTEVLAHEIWQRMALQLAAGELGPHVTEIASLRVTLHESHLASAAYDAPLR